jgi:hypothetical protein
MARNLIPIEQARNLAPAKMRERMAQGTALTNRFADNVADAFPRLSIKGKVFRIIIEGRELIARDQSGHALAYLDVVLVNASAQLAKTYYTKGFVDGDQNPPDCWSLDSIRPDPSVPNKVNPTCPDCPMNAFGSRVTPDGKAAKACSDSRRIAVSLPHELADPGNAPTVLLLRVPQSSLKNMRNYTMDTLARNGFEPGGCVTRLSFDLSVAFPKLQFEFVSPVTDDEYERIVGLASSPFVASMLRAPDFSNVASAVNAALPAPAVGQRQAAPAFVPMDTAQVDAQQATADFVAAMQRTVATQQEVWTPIDGTDEEINEDTGEVRTVEKPQPQNLGLDPNVIVTKDGRFFNKATKKFVASQFPADELSVVETKQEEKPKRVRTKAAAAPAPEDSQPKGNGGDEPLVVAASPKLEALLAGMTPKK